MNLRMRHVLPTAPSPTRQILTFIFWRSIGIPRGGSSLAHVSGYKGVAHRLSIEIMAVPIRGGGESLITLCRGGRWGRGGAGTARSRRPPASRAGGIGARRGSAPTRRALLYS